MSEADAKHRGTKEYFLVYSELIQAVRYRGVTTYQAIAEIMGVPLSGSYMGRVTGQMLGAISREEQAQGRPMLSAVAVGVSGVPGQGFYALAEEFGKFVGGSKEEMLRFWEAERDAVYEEWKRDFKTKASSG